ncbi:MAG: diphthine--ammonia ligase [Candidatus Poseidoniaceae archaeon]|nr:diphthine--ammonia ligase [Candidatus Poseidoniaceae archaeon]
MVMRVAVLSSGGKDSSAAYWWAMCKGWDVAYLVTVTITGGDSHMFQVPGVAAVQYQAQLSGITWINVESEGIQEEEIDDLQSALEKLDIDGIVSGALRSDYQKSRLERMCQKLDIISWTPLWHQSSQQHMRDLVNNGFGIMLTGVSTEGMGEEWLGHTLSKESLTKLEQLSKKYRFNVDGEGGEYETLVLSGPHMDGKLEVEYQSNWDGVRGHIDFTQIKAVNN